ncbi:MAG TPA: DUF192 domain-containing protein [Steroidobacteraceae bacterium]|nr:DUF192 domain-containing protein [Steroidobacteraceae bacterium]
MSSQLRLRHSIILRSALCLLLAGGLASMCAAQSLEIESLSHFPRATLDITARGRAHRFQVWIADTALRQEQGLMFVRDLPASEGMLFPQDSPQVAHFWMKNTYIPLDMVFVGEDGRIAKIIANARPFSLDVLSSDVPVIAVLEIRGGEAQQLGIGVGDPVRWQKPRPPAGAARPDRSERRGLR